MPTPSIGLVAKPGLSFAQFIEQLVNGYFPQYVSDVDDTFRSQTDVL